MATRVLDASALLAYRRDEPGAAVVSDAIALGGTIGTVNLAEVLDLPLGVEVQQIRPRTD